MKTIITDIKVFFPGICFDPFRPTSPPKYGRAMYSFPLCLEVAGPPHDLVPQKSHLTKSAWIKSDPKKIGIADFSEPTNHDSIPHRIGTLLGFLTTEWDPCEELIERRFGQSIFQTKVAFLL